MPPSKVPRKVIAQLADAGYAPTTIALTLDVPIQTVIAAIPGQRKMVAAADELLQDAMRALAWRTIQEAARILDEGTPQMKMAIITKFGGQMNQVLGRQEPNEIENLREDFYKLMAEVREGGDELEDHPDSEEVVDQDEGPVDRPRLA